MAGTRGADKRGVGVEERVGVLVWEQERRAEMSCCYGRRRG